MAVQRVTTRRHFVEDYKRSQLSLTDDLSLYLSQLIGRAKSAASNISLLRGYIYICCLIYIQYHLVARFYIL